MTLDERPSDAELLALAASRSGKSSRMSNRLRPQNTPQPESAAGKKRAARLAKNIERQAKAEAAGTKFRLLCKANGMPMPTTEFTFASPRRWRFDYAWEPEKIALEVEGGIWTNGRHTRGAGFLADAEKYNCAALMGWCVLRVTPQTLCTDATVQLVHRALVSRAVAVSDSTQEE